MTMTAPMKTVPGARTLVTPGRVGDRGTPHHMLVHVRQLEYTTRAMLAHRPTLCLSGLMTRNT